jgi:hypothetical protein
MNKLSLLVLTPLALCNCTVVDGGHEPAGGVFTVSWSIDDYQDPADCQQSGASTILVTVETRSGARVGEYEAPCEDFDTSIDLPPGRYQGSAVLLDRRGHDRTTEVFLDPFSLYGGDEVPVDIDFPPGSFL